MDQPARSLTKTAPSLGDLTASSFYHPTQKDTDHISILGFSAGDYTALATSGARVDPQRLQSFCDGADHGMSDCAFLAQCKPAGPKTLENQELPLDLVFPPAASSGYS